MGNTITIRLPEEMAKWLADSAARAGVSQGKIIRDQLEKTRSDAVQPFLQLAGRVSKSAGLSTRKGFSRK